MLTYSDYGVLLAESDLDKFTKFMPLRVAEGKDVVSGNEDNNLLNASLVRTV